MSAVEKYIPRGCKNHKQPLSELLAEANANLCSLPAFWVKKNRFFSNYIKYRKFYFKTAFSLALFAKISDGMKVYNATQVGYELDFQCKGR